METPIVCMLKYLKFIISAKTVRSDYICRKTFISMIAKKEEIMKTSTSGRYVPPPLEAPSANKLGFVVIVAIVIFLISLIFLDLGTLRRDIFWMLKNIRLQKRLWQAKKRLRETKRKCAKFD
ncbi:hypothetical protein ACTXT7_002637 [Hymenolepis weldensis]